MIKGTPEIAFSLRTQGEGLRYLQVQHELRPISRRSSLPCCGTALRWAQFQHWFPDLGDCLYPNQCALMQWELWLRARSPCEGHYSFISRYKESHFSVVVCKHGAHFKFTSIGVENRRRRLNCEQICESGLRCCLRDVNRSFWHDYLLFLGSWGRWEDWYYEKRKKDPLEVHDGGWSTDVLVGWNGAKLGEVFPIE